MKAYIMCYNVRADQDVGKYLIKSVFLLKNKSNPVD